MWGTWDQGPPGKLEPSFSRTSYGSWPRTTPEDAYMVDPPPEECRSLFGATSGVMTRDSNNPVDRILTEVCGESRLGSLLREVTLQALTREKLELSVRALARVLQAVITGDRAACNRPPSVRLVEVAGSSDAARCCQIGSTGSQGREGSAGLGAEDRGKNRVGVGQD